MDNRLIEIGERIRRVRMAKHISQARLAEILNVSPPYISNIEKGKQAMSITVLIGISNALNVSADWLLRNQTKEAGVITMQEVIDVLEDCSPMEKETILKLAFDVKTALRRMNPPNSQNE